MTESTEAQGRLHPALVGTEARRVIEIAKAHGALGWKVNGAGGEGGSLTLLCGESSARKRALVREIEQDSPGVPEHPDLPQPARPARLAPGPRGLRRPTGPRLGYPWPMRSWVGASRGGRASPRPAGRRATSTTSASRGCCTGGRSARPSRPARSTAVAPRLRPRRLHRRRPPRHPRPQRRRAHRGRPALPRRARGAPRRGAGPAPRPRGPRRAARGRGASRRTGRPSPSSTPSGRRGSFKEIAIEKGDLARGFAEADVVVEGEYRTGRQEHVYIEPNGVIAVPGRRTA